MKINLGVLGLGRIGKLHVENVVTMKEFNIVAVADVIVSEETKNWAEGLGIKNIYSDPAKVINDESINAVLICSSTNTHGDFIIQCAKAGKHIFCEKPIDFDIDKINYALSEVAKSGVKLQIGFVRRFDHNHKKVRDVVASGSLGNPHIVKVSSRDPEPPPIEYVKVSGGLFADMMIHDFDMARYLAGSEIIEVMAFGNAMIDERIAQYDDIDTAAVMVKFENGAIGIIDNSRKAGYGYDQRTEVHCAKGCVQVYNDLQNTSMVSTADGVQIEKPVWFFLERYNEAFKREISAFADSLINGKEIAVDGNDGLMSVKIAYAAKKSLKENRPVKLSEI